MRQMFGGMAHDREAAKHMHLWDDDDGFILPRSFKPFHTWSFDDWIENEKANSREHDRNEAQTHKLYEVFHLKHEKWYQESGTGLSFFGAFINSTLGNIFLLIIFAFSGIGIYVVVNECRKSAAPLKAGNAPGRSAFRRGEVRSAKAD